MEYRLLGRTGVRVSPLCLGTFNFGAATSEPDAVRITHAAMDAGINFIDTADAYHAGASEQVVGKALEGRRDRVVLATKVHGRMRPGPNGAGLSRNKLAAMRDLATRARAGEVPRRSLLLRWPQERIVERLTAVRGVGRWTVEMLLIFNLGFPDVLPLDDYGVRKGFVRAFGGALTARGLLERRMARRGERWRPYRSVASWYLWRIAELRGPSRESDDKSP